MERRAAQPVGGASWFVAGAVILLLFGAVHAVAVVASLVGTLDDPALAELTDHAKRVPLFQKGPFSATAHGASQILTTSYSILLLFAGMLDLLAWRPLAAAGRFRSLVILNLALTISLTAVTVVWQFPPPMVFAAAATACFVIATWRQSVLAPGAGDE